MAKIERKTITQSEILECFEYKDGLLYWKKINKYSSKKIGNIAGRITTDNRRSIGINNQVFYSSRLIFLYHHGWLPEIVDHKDRDTLNDRIENLRAADSSKNQGNKTKSKNKTSIYKGVSFVKTDNRRGGFYKYWCSIIYIAGKAKYMGYFKTEREAALAYNRGAVKIFGEFANLNIIQP